MPEVDVIVSGQGTANAIVAGPGSASPIVLGEQTATAVVIGPISASPVVAGATNADALIVGAKGDPGPAGPQGLDGTIDGAAGVIIRSNIKAVRPWAGLMIFFIILAKTKY